MYVEDIMSFFILSYKIWPNQMLWPLFCYSKLYSAWRSLCPGMLRCGILLLLPS